MSIEPTVESVPNADFKSPEKEGRRGWTGMRDLFSVRDRSKRPPKKFALSILAFFAFFAIVAGTIAILHGTSRVGSLIGLIGGAAPDVSRPFDAALAERRFYEEKVENGHPSSMDLSTLAGILASDARRTGDAAGYDRADELARRSLAELPFPNVQARVVLAQGMQARHRFDEAIRAANEIRKSSKSAGALSILVTSHLAKGNYEDAARFADELVDQRPGESAYALRALVAAAQNRPIDVREDFENALRVRDPSAGAETAWTRTLYARFLLAVGEVEAARKEIDSALRADPTSHFAVDERGLILRALGKDDEAIGEFRNAFGLSKQALYLIHLGESKLRAGDPEAGRAILSQAEKSLRSELRDGAFGHRAELVRTLLLLRDDSVNAEEIVTLARSELGVRRTAETLTLYALALRRRGKNAEALSAIREGYRLGGVDSEKLCAFALIEFDSGDFPHAAALAARAHALQPRAAASGSMACPAGRG